MAKSYNTITPFDNLQEVFDNAGPGDRIQLSEGDFRIKSTIFVPGLTICGAGSDKTRLIWDDYAEKIHAEKLTTPSAPGRWRSAPTTSQWRIWRS